MSIDLHESGARCTKQKWSCNRDCSWDH